MNKAVIPLRRERRRFLAVLLLIRLEQEFARNELSSIGYRNQREPELARALVAMAAEMGVTLQEPLHIDANGEYSIIAVKPDGSDPRYGCGEFGQAFADALTTYKARTGVRSS